MATSGTIQATIRTGYRIQIAWTVDSQSVANNTSSVTAKVQLVSTGTSYTINSSASKSGSLTINGTKYTFNFTASLSGNQTKTIFTKTVTVAHNADGSKTCAFACSCGINVTLSGTYYGTVSASGNGVFNTIARASTISSVTASVSVTGSNAVTVNIARASSSFTHTVLFRFGSYSQSFTGVATSQAYTIPQSWLNAIPSATSGVATVTVTTYSGSTKIGSAVSKNFTLTVPANIVPTISGVAVADTVTAVYNFFGNMVQTKSRPKFTITAAGALSSTITAYKTVFEGKTYTGAAPMASTITGSGTVTAKITVTDSRGRSATVNKSWTVLPYSAPKIIGFQGFRCLADGTENYDGTYLSATVNFSIAPVGQKNTKSYSVDYKLKAAETWVNLTSGSVYALNQAIVSATSILGADSSFDIRLTITDHFTTVRSAFEIPTAFTLLDFNAGGKALAFGKVSELAFGIEFGMPAYFTNAETPSSVTYLTEGQDFNTILEPGFYAVPTTAISGTLTNKPYTGTSTGSLIVLREGNGGQRSQIFHTANKANGAIYERCYYSGTWGEWKTVYNGGGKILWSGGMYMTEGHKITLAEPVLSQPSGIVLIFSRYSNGAVADTNFSSFFVPKTFVNEKRGYGNMFVMFASPTLQMAAAKYLYINNEYITGHAQNAATGTSDIGIKYMNNEFVLRYVIGV